MKRTALVLRLGFAMLSLTACGAEDIILDPPLVANDGKTNLDGALPTEDVAQPPQDATADEPAMDDVQVADNSVPDVTVPDVTVPDVTVPDVTVPDVIEADVVPPRDAGPDVRDAAPDVVDAAPKDVNVADVPADNTVPPDADDDGEAEDGSGRGGGGPGPSGN